jgi:hypothetical protein
LASLSARKSQHQTTGGFHPVFCSALYSLTCGMDTRIQPRALSFATQLCLSVPKTAHCRDSHIVSEDTKRWPGSPSWGPQCSPVSLSSCCPHQAKKAQCAGSTLPVRSTGTPCLESTLKIRSWLYLQLPFDLCSEDQGLGFGEPQLHFSQQPPRLPQLLAERAPSCLLPRPSLWPPPSVQVPPAVPMCPAQWLSEHFVHTWVNKAEKTKSDFRRLIV